MEICFTILLKIEKTPSIFSMAKDVIKKGFHKMAWDTYYLPKAYDGMNLFDFQK